MSDITTPEGGEAWVGYNATQIAERGAWAVCAEYEGHIERLLEALAQERSTVNEISTALATREVRIAELEVELRRARGC